MAKRQKVLFAILGLVLIYAVFDLITAGSNKSQLPKKMMAEAKQPDLKDELMKQVQEIRGSKNKNTNIRNKSLDRNIQHMNGWIRDPFIVKYENQKEDNLRKMLEKLENSKTNGLSLTAISRKGNTSHVLINDEILTIGETIKGFKIIEIKKNSVILKRDNYSFTLNFQEDS